MLFEIRYGPLLNVRTTTEVPEIQDLQHPKLTAPPLQPKPLGQIVGSVFLSRPSPLGSPLAPIPSQLALRPS